MQTSMEPRPGDLARARVLAELFQPHDAYQARVRLPDGRTVLGRVWAGSAEEAGHRAAIAGEVISVERAV
ncbi:MAG: hypothetical protein AB9879_09910 [Methanothrix sp.]